MENIKNANTNSADENFDHMCPFFTSVTDVNGGYGCTHPNQGDKRMGADGNLHGVCRCHSCPLSIVSW